MDPRYTGEMFRHLEKQNELLMDAYRSMSHELHKLQVEEEMLMRKFYELMSAQGLAKKEKKNTTVDDVFCPTKATVAPATGGFGVDDISSEAMVARDPSQISRDEDLHAPILAPTVENSHDQICSRFGPNLSEDIQGQHCSNLGPSISIPISSILDNVDGDNELYSNSNLLASAVENSNFAASSSSLSMGTPIVPISTGNDVLDGFVAESCQQDKSAPCSNDHDHEVGGGLENNYNDFLPVGSEKDIKEKTEKKSEDIALSDGRPKREIRKPSRYDM